MIHNEQISTSDTEFLLREDTQQTKKRVVVTYLETARRTQLYHTHLHVYIYDYAPCC